MNGIRFFLILITVFPTIFSAYGQNLPQATALPGDNLIPGASKEKNISEKSLPGDKTIPSTNAYDLSDPEIKAAIDASKKTLDNVRNQILDKADSSLSPPEEVSPSEVSSPPDESISEVHRSSSFEPKSTAQKNRNYNKNFNGLDEKSRDPPLFTDTKGGVRIFNQALRSAKRLNKDSFTLPSTSIAMATTLYGIEAIGSADRYVPAELNYAWLGPNGTIVEMKNCRIWLIVRGDYSTERIYGKSQSMSCRAASGETFDIPIEAHMVDQAEEYLGARGTLVARGKALASAMSFLSDGVKSFGAAMSAAQVNTEVTPSSGLGDPIKGSNVGGDKNQYIVGQTLSGSSAKFLDWWIEYYQSLSPTIAIGPGKKIYLALQKTVQIPKIFFGNKIKNSDPSIVTRLNPSDDNVDISGSRKVNTKNDFNVSQQSDQDIRKDNHGTEP